MSYPRFPSSLPRPLRSGFTIAAGDGRTITQPDAGTPRVRRRFSRAAKPVSLTFIFTRAERALFEQFCTETLQDHSLAFLMADPSSDGWVLTDEHDVPLLDETGAPLTDTADWLVLFGQQLPSVTMAGIDFSVSFQLWVMPT